MNSYDKSKIEMRNSMGKKKAIGLTLVLLLSTLLFAGCSKKTVYVPVTANTIELTEDGRLIGYIVEPFEKEYYDINELETMVRSEIDEYNTEKQELSTEAGRLPILVDKVMMAEDGSPKAVVALNFQSAAVYEDYMGKEIFLGTVAEAMDAGYDVDNKLTEVKGGTAFTGEQIQKNKDKKILILEDAVSVRTAGKVQYLSGNAKKTAEGFVDCTADEELKYIIYK